MVVVLIHLAVYCIYGSGLQSLMFLLEGLYRIGVHRQARTGLALERRVFGRFLEQKLACYIRAEVMIFWRDIRVLTAAMGWL